MFGNPSQKKVKPTNVELFQSALVNEVWLSWLRRVISFCGPPVSESFENQDAYAWVCIGLFTSVNMGPFESEFSEFGVSVSLKIPNYFIL